MAVAISPVKMRDELSSVLERIWTNWQKSVRALLAVARDCLEANAQLQKSERADFFGRLPFDRSIFSKLVGIGNDVRLQSADIQQLLPPHYSIIYELTLLNDDELNLAIAEEVIHPSMKRRTLEQWRKARQVAPLASAPTQAPAAISVNGEGVQTAESKDPANAAAEPNSPTPSEAFIYAAVEVPESPPMESTFVDKIRMHLLDEQGLSAEDKKILRLLAGLYSNASEVVQERFDAYREERRHHGRVHYNV